MSLRAGELRMMLDPTLEAIEQFSAFFRLWQVQTCAGLDAFSAELLLREALTNSVVHGSSSGSSHQIQVVLRAKRGRLLMAIEDGGDGFDWRAAWERRADSCDTRGRGVEIYRHYASRVRFNPKGNSVILIKRF